MQFESLPQNLFGRLSGDGVSLVKLFFVFALLDLYYDGKKHKTKRTGCFPVLQALPDDIKVATHAIIVKSFIKKEVPYEKTGTIFLLPIVTILR